MLWTVFAFCIVPIIVDWLIGDPPSWPHPVRYIGKWISFVEKWLRKTTKHLKAGSFFLLFSTVGMTVLVVTLIQSVSYRVHPFLGHFVTIWGLSTTLAAKCLKEEVMKVYDALSVDVNLKMETDYEVTRINAGRKALSYLVGRDTMHLTETQIIKGAIETTAENTIDGVLAPLFYMGMGLLFGLPLQFAFAYKAINTLDSMVGYLVPKYKDIGFASAKADDLVNYLPARLGSLCMWLVVPTMGGSMKRTWKIFIRDRRNHKSPNCGYPESIAAGALQIQLGGTHTYFDELIEKPTIGDAVLKPTLEMVPQTIQLLFGSELIMMLIMLIMVGGALL